MAITSLFVACDSSAENLLCTGIVGVGAHETCFLADFGVCHSSAGVLGVDGGVDTLHISDEATNSLICATQTALTLFNSSICFFNSENSL